MAEAQGQQQAEPVVSVWGESDREFMLHYLDLDTAALHGLLIAEGIDPRGHWRTDALKVRAVERLGFEVRQGETALEAWMRGLHEINGLPLRYPCDRELAEAIVATPGVARFMYALI